MITKITFITTLATFSSGTIHVAKADDPLKYPPFSWPAEDNVKSSPSVSKKSVKPGKTDFYQTKDESRQWYDGDFLGMDDD